MDELRRTEARVERLVAQLANPPRVGEKVEELVRLLMRLYGDGLARITALLPPDDLVKLAADDLVGSLLILHDLHPLGTEERVAQALDGIRPYLGARDGGVELVGVDGAGVVRLRLRGAGGCPSSAGTAEQVIERAVQAVAPEITGVRVERAAPEPPLLQIRSGPPPGFAAPLGRGAQA
ncbi:NifU family protein [Streptomyces sp. NPDC003077]|uniref:NifU family protein n=1 Tax=Streptomyces sp. NPDC003077 TaxID=3154443 RepID=UPI0033BB6785